jgi:hypothetical protein
MNVPSATQNSLEFAMPVMMRTFLFAARFSDWPNADVPAVAAGVYAVWEGEQLTYCGMSGRGLEKALGTTPKLGLATRLASHASGRLSGDQLCVYVANRLVIASLRPDQLAQFADGQLTLDTLTRQYIHERLAYQFACVDTSAEAFALERQSRIGSVFGVKPFLNPL